VFSCSAQPSRLDYAASFDHSNVRAARIWQVRHARDTHVRVSGHPKQSRQKISLGPDHALPAVSSRRSLAAKLTRSARWSIVLAALIASIALLGHLTEIKALATFVPGWPAVRPAVAIAVLGTAAAFGLLQSGRRAVGLLMLVVLASAAMGVMQLPGEPLPVYSASMLLIVMAGIALVYLRGDRHLAAARLLAMASATLLFTAFIGISYRLLLALPPLVDVSLPTLSALLCLTYAIVVIRPDAWLIEALTSPRPGDVMTRRLMPAVLGLPIIIGWIEVAAEGGGILDSAFGAVLQTVLTVFALAGLMLWGAHRLDRLDLQRSEAEREALAQREWLQVTIRSCGEAVVATDAAGVVRLVNPAAAKLAGRSSSELIGRAIGEAFPLTARDSIIQHPVLTVLNGAVPDPDGELKLNGGHARHVEVTVAPIHGSEGALQGAVMTLRDVSLRHQNEQALREAYAQLDRRVAERTAALERANAALHESLALVRGVAESTPDLIIVKDREGRVIMANPAQVKVIGRAESEIVGHTDREFLDDGELAAQVMENDRRILSSGRVERLEETMQTPEGTRTYLSTRSPLCDARGNVTGIIRVATDITDRKMAEVERERLLATEQRLRHEAERANRAKDEFLAIVSHELRSPLNALRGWGFLLSSAKAPDASLIERATQAIKRNVDQQARLIDDLLDTSRIMSGKLNIERQQVNLLEVVHAAMEVVRPSTMEKHITLELNATTETILLEGDPARLQQIVVNLLFNAVKFTPEGGQIKLSLQTQGLTAHLSVTDNGVGIAPEFLPRVFDRFSQADTSTTRRHGGLGIGLALVRHLTELHNGKVSAHSAGVNKGSTFTVELPIAAPSATKAPSDAVESASSNAPARSGAG
jgi:PAS domain S-box-containing protein